MKKRILMALLAAMTAVSIAACSSEETAGDNVQESSEGNTSDNADLPEDVDASAGASIQVRDSDITGNTGVEAQCGLSWPHRPEISAGIPLFSSAIRTGGATCR